MEYIFFTEVSPYIIYPTTRVQLFEPISRIRIPALLLSILLNSPPKKLITHTLYTFSETTHALTSIPFAKTSTCNYVIFVANNNFA